MSADPDGASVGGLRLPVDPVLAETAASLPTGPDWRFEPKWDGWRSLLAVGSRGVRLLSRHGKQLGLYFPDLTRAAAVLPVGTVLDGEIIVWAGDTTSFVLLQRRLVAGGRVNLLAHEHPAHYVAFDLLAHPEFGPMLERPLHERRAQLAALLADAPPQFVLCPQTEDPDLAREWMTTWTATGVEGIVAKRARGRYRPGRRDWVKVKTREAVDVIAGGVTGVLARPGVILLGRYDAAGRLRHVGRTTPLTDAQGAELRPHLVRAGPARGGGIAHPWPVPLPAAWTGPWGGQPQPYVPVTPIVVEVAADTAAMTGRRWRHPVPYLRVRADLPVHEATLLVDEQ